MGGFNYGGGKGDGTGWSSERGNTPNPGGGDNGNAGSRENNGNGSRVLGLWAGNGPLRDTLINNVINEALDKKYPESLYDATNTASYGALRAAFNALPVDQQPEARDQINHAFQNALSFMADKVSELKEYGGRNGRFVVIIIENPRKQKMKKVTEYLGNDLQDVLRNNQEKDAITSASAIIIDFGKTISTTIGDRYNNIANEIANEIKNFQGKRIRNFNDAIATINKVTSNPGMKINNADKEAISNALSHINSQDISNRLGNLSKAFKAADIAQKTDRVREKTITGVRTGDWSPLMLEVESWVLAGVASAAALAIFSAIAGALLPAALVSAPVTIAIGAVVTVLVGSLIDDRFADQINNALMRPAY